MEFLRCFRCMEEAASYPCPHCGYTPEEDWSKDYVLRPGTILNGKYVVGTPLGQGGFGITYIGWDLLLDNRVAIKEYFPSGQVGRSATGSLHWYSTPQAETARNSGKEMFLKEARKMSRVREIPQVVHIRDLFQQNDTAYIVMDFVEGETLMARLKKTGPLNWNQARDIFFPTIRAMAQVHEEGLIHRDLSPDNLMLLHDGSVKILDLGAAKDLTINSGASSMQVAKGGFSPLEQYTQRGGSGAWSDVYAMAATMYYTLTGLLPPNAVDRLEDDQIRWDLPQLAALPQGVVAALRQAMAVSAKARTQSMGDFLAQLEKAETKPKPALKQKKKISLLPIVAAVLAVALISGITLWPREKTEPQLESQPQTEPSSQVVSQPQEETQPQPDVIPGEVTLKVWGPYEDQVDENSFLQQATAKFAENHPEYQITWVFEVCAEVDVDTQVATDPAAAADVYAFNNDNLAALLQANAIAPLHGDVLEQVKADNSETMIASVTSGGEVYGVPFTSNTWFMYYDASVYTEEDIKSLDAMMAKAPVAFPVTNSWYLPAFYYAVGGTMFGDGTDGTAGIRFGGENGAKATLYIANALASGALIDDASGAGLDGLRNGAVSAIFSGSWDAASVKEILGNNFAAAQLPCITIDGKECQMYAFSGSTAYGVNPNSANLKLATELAAWLGSSEMQDLHYELRDGFVMPCSSSLIASGKYDSEPTVTAKNDTIANTSKLQPSVSEMINYWMNADSMSRALANGEINAANAAAMTEKWNAALNGAVS